MPALDNPRWEQFAQFIVAGETQLKAYELAFGNSHPSVVVSASQLVDKQPVSDRIHELRRIGLGSSPILTLQEKRMDLASVWRTPVGKLDENHHLVQSVKRKRDKDGNESVEIEMVNKLKALELDAKLAGELNSGGAPTVRISMYAQAAEVQVEAIEVESTTERITDRDT